MLLGCSGWLLWCARCLGGCLGGVEWFWVIVVVLLGSVLGRCCGVASGVSV